MALSARQIGAYLAGWRRVRARERLDDVMTAGFFQLGEQVRRRVLAQWAQISRGEEESDAAAAGVTTIPANRVREWVQSHGGRF